LNARRPATSAWWIASLLLGLLAANVSGRANEGDLRVYYDTVSRLGQGLDLYQQLEGPAPERPTGFIYPPPFAVAFLPLTWLPFSWLRFLWCWGMGLCALRALHNGWWLVRAELGGAGEERPWAPWLAAGLGLAFSARFLLSDLGHGQVNLLVLCLTLEGVARAWREEERSASACLALAVLCKLTPAIVVLGYLLRGRRRLVRWTLGWGLLFAALPTALLGAGAHASALWRFVTVITPWNASQHAYVANNLALGAWLQRALVGVAPAGELPRPWLLALSPEAGHVVSLCAGLGVLVAVSWWAARAAAARAAGLRAGVLLSAVPLVAPVAWKPHLVAVLLAGLYAGRALLRGDGPRGARLALWSALLLLAGTSRLFLGRELSDAATRWGAPTLGCALLLLGLCVQPEGEGAQQESAPSDRGGGGGAGEGPSPPHVDASPRRAPTEVTGEERRDEG
jgi:hypothetical protein